MILLMLNSNLTCYATNINLCLSIISTESCTRDGHQCTTMDTALLRKHRMDIYKTSSDM
jgi:hypothetical protein